MAFWGSDDHFSSMLNLHLCCAEYAKGSEKFASSYNYVFSNVSSACFIGNIMGLFFIKPQMIISIYSPNQNIAINCNCSHGVKIIQAVWY